MSVTVTLVVAVGTPVKVTVCGFEPKANVALALPAVAVKVPLGVLCSMVSCKL